MKKRPVGRPKQKYTKDRRMNMRLGAEDICMLMYGEEKTGMSRSNFVRWAVKEACRKLREDEMDGKEKR